MIPVERGVETSRKEPDLPAHALSSRRKVDEQRMSVVVVRDVEALASYVEGWDDLTASAIEPNIFYESWMLMQAARS